MGFSVTFFLTGVFKGVKTAWEERQAEAETVVAKILRYQQDPTRDVGADWLRRGLVVAADYGSSTPRPVSRWCRDILLEHDYTQVDSVYYPPWDGPGVGF